MMLSLLACFAVDADQDADSALAPLDVRFDVPAVPDAGQQWITPDIVVPAYADQHTCIAGTYTGPDIGATQIETFQAEGYGHHLLIWVGELDPELYPDGTAFDCSNAAVMSGWLPIFIVHPDRTENGAFVASADLPEGMGISLENGTRTIIQSHYLNTTDHDILTRDVINFDAIPAAEVERWAAAWGDGLTDMPLPPGEDTTHAFDCTWPTDVNILYMFGHMHQHGTSFALDHTQGGITTRPYEVTDWDPDFRDTPPLTEWQMPGYPVSAGDVFRTSCSFYNDTDKELNYPDEMCASSGILYPSKTPIFCNPGD